MDSSNLIYHNCKDAVNKCRESVPFTILTVSMSTFTDTFLYSVVVPIMPFSLRNRMHIAESNIQFWIDLSLAMYSVGLIIPSPIFGYLSDRSSCRKLPMIIGLILLILATLLIAVTKSVQIYVFGRFIQGISGSIVWSVGLAIVSDVASKDQITFLISFPSLAVSAGTILGPVIGGIVYQRLGYDAVFQLSIVIIGIDVILRVLMKETKSKERIEEEQKELETTTGKIKPASPLCMLTMLKTPRIANGLVQSLVIAWQLTALDATMTVRLASIFNFDSLQSGLMFLPIALPSVIDPLVGYLCDKFGSRYFITGGFLLASIPLMLLQIPNKRSVHDIVVFAVLLGVYGLCSTMIFSPILSELSDSVGVEEAKDPGRFGKGKGYGQVYALFNIAYSLGSLLGPLQAGHTLQSSGWSMLMISLGIMSLIMVIPSFFLSGKKIIKDGRLESREETLIEEGNYSSNGHITPTKDHSAREEQVNDELEIPSRIAVNAYIPPTESPNKTKD